MEPLPDLAALSDQQLKDLIEELERDESEVSYRRRLLQGRIDILRAERAVRLRKSLDVGKSPLADADTLTDILAREGPPPAEDTAA